MSEFLAEARVVISPDTTRFRPALIAELAAVTKGVTVPIPVVPIAGTAGLSALTAGSLAAAQAQSQLAGATKAKAEVDRLAEKESARHVRQLGQVRTAALASGAAMVGLRGAVLTAGAAFLGATVAFQAAGRAISSAADLETELNVFRVTAGATADEMERVSEQAEALGRDLTLPGVTASDAAQTFLALSRAGLSVENSLEGARGVLQLAVAAQISFADAAQITASALNAFSLQGEEAVSVADLLTNSANASQASIAEMGIALRQSAAIADLAGFSLSETATFLTQLARAGLAGSDAGTSFRVAIQRLIAPTDEARAILERLVPNLRDLQGNLRPEAFFDLGEALERMGRAQADATRQVIFGNDASRAAAFFARLNSEAFREQEKSLTRAGAAAEVAGARNAGFAGSVENLKNQLSALGIEIGQLALPPLGAAADTAALLFGALATQVSDSKDALGDLGEIIGGAFSEDIDKLADAVRELTEESGFEEFFNEVGDGARVFERGLRIANSALESLVGDLNPASSEFREITDEERKFQQSVLDSIKATKEQSDSLDELTTAAQAAAASIARLQGQERGLAEQVTRARIAGDENAEIVGLRAQRAALEEELRQQEEIIARPGTRGEATAREAIRNRILPQLEAVNNEINNIIEGQRIENERLVQDAARAANERDRNLLEALSGRREDAERATSIAADTEGIADDIRAQNVLQALIKRQIQKVRDRIQDEKLRRETIRELRVALQASRREEAALRQEQREAQAQARADAIAQRAQSLELDIELADINENDSRRVALRRRRIAQLKREARLLKLEGNALKENRNERARIRKEIEGILSEEKEAARGFDESAFEFLQQQQGFAATLLGNLIPLGATGGLVGGTSTSPPPIEAELTQRAGLREVRDRGIGPAQFGTLIDIQARMLDVLIRIAGGRAHPEIRNQRQMESAAMDTLGA